VNLFSLGKKWLVAAAVIVAWPLPVVANIGDDLNQLRERYGSAKAVGGQMIFEVRLKDGKIEPARGSADPDTHFSVTVYFDGDHSAMEVFTRNTSDPEKANLSQDDISTILASENDGQDWIPVVLRNGKTAWVRSDKKLVARFDPSQDGDADSASVLVVMLNSK
jgi:hypothetical protein